MSSPFDPSDFVDVDLETARKTPSGGAAAQSSRPPSREEMDVKVTETQTKLAELKRAQENLEREQAALQEARRQQIELQTGRDEMTKHLTRGLVLLEEAEFAARRDAEQMGKTRADLQSALGKIQSIREDQWTKENCATELTRALTIIENARMEWNAARLKFTVLSGGKNEPEPAADSRRIPALQEQSFAQLCRLGLALTWPLVVLAAGILLLLLFR